MPYKLLQHRPILLKIQIISSKSNLKIKHFDIFHMNSSNFIKSLQKNKQGANITYLNLFLNSFNALTSHIIFHYAFT